MSVTRFLEAESVEAASRLLQEDPDARRIIGGGTGLMLMAQSGFLAADTLISLRHVSDEDVRQIRIGDDSVYLGGSCTLTEIEEHPGLATMLPVVTATLRRLSSVRTRNVATLAGAVVHGDPHMDLPPVLIALGARLVVVGRTGQRNVACEQLYRGYYDVALEPDDVVVGLIVPVHRPETFLAYRKFTGALAEDWPIVGVAVRLGCADGVVTEATIACSALEAAARRLPGVEQALLGAARSEVEVEVEHIAALAADEVEPIDDQLGSSWYKKRILAAELGRALRSWQQQGGADA